MNEVISIIEHQNLPIVGQREFGDIALGSKHSAILAELKTIPSNAFTWGHNCIKWQQFCGLVQLGDITLEVLPKVTESRESPADSRSTLIKMLGKAGLIKLHKPGTANIDLASCSLLDVFIADFCQQLLHQLAQGSFKQYVSNEENLGVLRGKLRVADQLKTNLAHKERLYCEYDELSEDNFINRAIKYALVVVLPKAKSSKLKRQISELLLRFDHVAQRLINPDLISEHTLNRNEQRFAGVLHYCELFIRNLAPNNTAGSHQAFSLLFDMNQLFEAWVSALLKPLAYELGLTLRTQGPRRYLAYRSDIQSDVFQMRPDVCFLDERGDVRLVADAKWKKLARQETKLGVSQSDMYQLHAYGNRYKCRNLALIYPRQMPSEPDHHFELHTDGSAASVLIASCSTQINKDPLLIDSLRQVIRANA